MSPSQRFEDRLRAAVALDIAYEHRERQSELERKILPQCRDAAVLALFSVSRSGEASILMTRRTDQVETHKGQMAFPGGMVDPEDHSAGGITATALRETEEEIGLPRQGIRVLGQLPTLWTVTRFLITPVVGMAAAPLEEIAFKPNPAEIDDVFWIPLKAFERPGVYSREWIEHEGHRYPIENYAMPTGHRIWGATGAMIRNLLERLNQLP